VKIDGLRHFRIYRDIAALLESSDDRDAAREWRSEMLLQWGYHQRLDKYRPAYLYFEKRVRELTDGLRRTRGDTAAIDRLLARRKSLLAALPEAAPDLVRMVELEIRAARGDELAREVLDAEQPAWVGE
jgi:hypothetical protein